jgi:hypothetical protein
VDAIDPGLHLAKDRLDQERLVVRHFSLGSRADIDDSRCMARGGLAYRARVLDDPGTWYDRPLDEGVERDGITVRKHSKEETARVLTRGSEGERIARGSDWTSARYLHCTVDERPARCLPAPEANGTDLHVPSRGSARTDATLDDTAHPEAKLLENVVGGLVAPQA